MDKLLELYTKLENTYCPYKEQDNKDLNWCEVCKTDNTDNYKLCEKINKRINELIF